jgi:hypothetical protein
VRAVAQAMGWTDAAADAYLTGVWNGMYTGNETAGDPATHAELRKFLEFQRPNDPTLPVAFTNWVMH